MKKKYIYNEKMKKKKICAENLIGLLPRLYCEKGFLYCSWLIYIAIGRLECWIVLQPKGVVLQNLCCRKKKTVSQYSLIFLGCIAGDGLRGCVTIQNFVL